MKKRRGHICALLFGAALLLAGCGNTELEARKFPLVLAVDKSTDGETENKKGGFQIEMGFQDLSQVADEKAKDAGNAPTKTEEMSWYQAFEESDSSSPKTMDYNHLKAIILSRELLEDKDMLGELLDFVREQEVFARNTLLFTSEKKAADILKLEGKLDMPVGTWLEELTAGNEEVDDSAIVTLGSLLNDYENRMENLYVPMLSVSEDTIQIENYYIISAAENHGVVEKDTFRRAMLLENKMKQFDFELEDGDAIRLTRIRTEKSYEQTDEEIVLTVRIAAEAKLQNGRIQTEEMQKEIKREAEETLTKQVQFDAALLLLEKQVDMANSFYSLGGYDRNLYRQYGKNISAYRSQLRIEVEFDITPVTE